MFKNYFTLNRHTIECNELLKGYTLIACFTQEKNKLVLHFKNDDRENFIEISTDHQTPYFLIKNRYNRAKKNTLSFFNNFLPSKLKSISIAEFDRIIKFELESSSIFFLIRGKETNVVLIKDSVELSAFKKLKKVSELLQELTNLKFTSSFTIPSFLYNIEEPFETNCLNQYPYFGKEIKTEFERRFSSDLNNDWKKVLIEILNEIKFSQPFLITDTLKNELSFSFFLNSHLQDKVEFYSSVNEALRFFLINKNRRNNLELETKFEQKLEDRLFKLEKKRDALMARLEKGCKEEYYKQIGNLLLMKVPEFKRGKNEITVENTFDSNNLIKIELIPRLNLKENIEYYFEKAKSERKEYDTSKILLNETIKNIEKIMNEKQSEMLNQAHLHENTMKKGKKHSHEGIKFRQFILFDKYFVYVGKNSKNNDELTTGFARQNDFWFHARNVSGSHVVLRYDKSPDDIQKNILEKAASIAAFYSKAKTSSLVPVSYTQKKYVIKRKGMPPGTVSLLKEKVLLVRPEIPKECIKVTDE
ncbi:MAG: fibronectin/fibrinogen-binding protein [Ignavibacteriaceae bacterium]|nr:fibronectin/fibrinogen-binding protein [Ignavibacteriaceae bacterium]